MGDIFRYITCFLGILISVEVNAQWLGDLRISITPQREVWELGDSFGLDVNLSNASKESFYVEFSGATYGPKAIDVTATTRDCQYNVQPIHFTRRIEDLRFDYKPLHPGETFSSSIAFGGYESGNIPDLNIRRPGNYQVTVTYCSEGDSVEGVVWPIWRGCASSSPVQVTVALPPKPVIDSWINKLLTCISEKDCLPYDAAFFSRWFG